MNLRFKSAIAAGLVAVAGTGISPASATPALVNFDPSQGIAQGPSIYVAVPGPQTIVTTPATFSGGVVLGLATFFPAIAFATSPNVYGTADFGNHLSKTLTIDISPSFLTTEVSFALFNGETFNQSYTVNAFDGTSQVATQTLTSVAPNWQSGYGLIDIFGSNITKVTIDAVGAPPVWDFLIDSVAFNQNVVGAINPPPASPPTPPPTPPVVQPPPPVFLSPPTPPVLDAQIIHVVETCTLFSHHGTVCEKTEKVETVEALEPVQLNYGDDSTNVKGNFLLVTPTPAVPEPESYAMMLAGLGLMGFVARRRKQQPA